MEDEGPDVYGHDDHDYDEDFGDDDDFDWECGLMPDGTCMLAGTEHCDWDCGRLNTQRIADMKAAREED